MRGQSATMRRGSPRLPVRLGRRWRSDTWPHRRPSVHAAAFSRWGEAISLVSGRAMAATRDLSDFVRHLDGGLDRMELAVDGLLSTRCTPANEGEPAYDTGRSAAAGKQ